jgi:type II secretory pathway predicted ATPase ExeA
MYVDYYNLKSEPFRITPDPKFAWLGEKHAEALATLEYGLQGNKGFVVLTGDVGTGKTLIINCLLNRLDPDVIAVKVQNPGMAPVDFFNFVAAKLGFEKGFNTKGKFLLHFEDFLHQAHSEGKKVLLVVDEAHRLSPRLLQEIRLLSNIELEYEKLLNIFIVGQVELEEILARDKNKALRERISVWYRIDPLTEAETRQYVDHRLEVAGSESEIFEADALQEIFRHSKGIPRLINILCDQALLTGLASNVQQIDGNVIRECAQDLKLFTVDDGRQSPAPEVVAEEALPVESLPPAPGIVAEEALPVESLPARRRLSALHVFAGLAAILLIIIAGLVYNLRTGNLEGLIPWLTKNEPGNKAPAATREASVSEETRARTPEVRYFHKESREDSKTEIESGPKAQKLKDARPNAKTASALKTPNQ